jgi:hypothetical protein
MRCDCGYDFLTDSMQDSVAVTSRRKRPLPVSIVGVSQLLCATIMVGYLLYVVVAYPPAILTVPIFAILPVAYGVSAYFTLKGHRVAMWITTLLQVLHFVVLPIGTIYSVAIVSLLFFPRSSRTFFERQP